MNIKLKGAIYGKYGSQIDFAQAHGIDETHISKIVMGRRQISPKDQKQWAKWLECKVEDIFG
jgi:DNA-binding Xre family transcriptional regulator